MKHLTSASGTRLIVLTLGIGCLTVLGLMLWASNPASASRLDSAPQVGIAAPPALQKVVLNAAAPVPHHIACTSQYTNVSTLSGYDPIGNNTSVGNLSDLSLIGDANPGDVKTTQDHFFRLYPAQPSVQYTLQAFPDTTGSNYDLGILVYYSPDLVSYTDVYTQLNLTTKSATASFVATNQGPYYFQVFQKTADCRGGVYKLQFSSISPTATPVTPSPTPITPAPGTITDTYEINDTIAQAKPIPNTVTGLTLCNLAYCDPNVINGDKDYFKIYAVAGYQVTVSAAPDSAYPYLFMAIIGPNQNEGNPIYQNPSSLNPSYSWTAAETGAYYIHLQGAASSPTNGTYHLNWSTNGPTLTPSPTGWTPGPTDTPVPGLDAFEPNWDFDHAAGIGLNVKYTGINFVPLPGQSVNNDYFKVRVKGGMLVTCETLDLSAGTDTNMILYDDNRQGLAGNDDVDRTRGELRSRVTVSINYDGFLYILVGQGYAVPNSQAALYTYSLQCTVGAGQVTATPTPPPGATTAPPASVPTSIPPVPTTPPPSATSPATAMPPISVRALPTPTPAGPVQQMVTADLQVYYDANDNGIADPGEGVVGLPARVYDATTGALLAQGFTNDTGHAVFSVPAAGPIRVVVPYLGFEATVPPSGAAIPVLISPRELPKQIP